MKPNPLPFILERWHGIPRPSVSFAGKVIIVTGGNTGLGFHAAKSYAELDAELVILAVRDLTKGATACRKIEEQSKVSKLDVWELDMSDYGSITRFVARTIELPSVDVVVLNAGTAPADYVISSYGWESALQTNVLSTALLGLLLLPKLQGSVNSHLLVVTSEAHRWLEESDFPETSKPLLAANIKHDKWDPLLQNAKSKLFAMYVAQELSCMANNRVIVTSICPGACKSDLMRDLRDKSFGQRLALGVFDLVFNKPTEQGGWTYVWATTLDERANGKWYKTAALAEPGILVTSENGKRMGKQVWTEVISSLGSSVSEVRNLNAGATV